MYRSKTVDRVPLRRDNATHQDTRARELLNSAEPLDHALGVGGVPRDRHARKGAGR